jgi:hypothetical protein
MKQLHCAQAALAALSLRQGLAEEEVLHRARPGKEKKRQGLAEEEAVHTVHSQAAPGLGSGQDWPKLRTPPAQCWQL